jgi:hypothetical protein
LTNLPATGPDHVMLFEITCKSLKIAVLKIAYHFAIAVAKRFNLPATGPDHVMLSERLCKSLKIAVHLK